MNRPNGRRRAATIVAIVAAGCLLVSSRGGTTPRALFEGSTAAAATVGSITMTVGTCPGGDSGAICGDSTKQNHVGAMDLSSVTFGGSTPTTIGSGGTTQSGAMRFDTLSVSKSPDSGSTALLTRMATGQQLERVVISFDTAGGATAPVTILRYTMLPAVVTSVTEPTNVGSSVENVTIAIGAVKVEVFKLTPTGTVTAAGTFCWSAITNSATCP